MKNILREKSREYAFGAFVEWLFWMFGSVLLIMFIKWCMEQYGASGYEFHIWLTGTFYLWYVSTMSLLISGTYFISRAAQTHLERRQTHPQKPDNIDLTNDIDRIKKIKKRAGIAAIVLHSLSAAFVYYVSRHIQGLTLEYRIYAVLGVAGIAAVKPCFFAINTIRIEIFGMLNEADYPVKTVADLWRVVEQFGDYEKRLQETFKELEKAKIEHETVITDTLNDVSVNLKEYKAEMVSTFQDKVDVFKQSDEIRLAAYNDLKDAQIPVTKEIGKVLAAIQTLKEFVIELRDKNIKGEQLMSALKEFGIESLSELNVSFEKSVVDRNPGLQNQAPYYQSNQQLNEQE
jgi:hypothetical protein